MGEAVKRAVPCPSPPPLLPPQAEAAAYSAALRVAADAAGLERAPSGAPRFDLVLLGMGADGHVGSHYPTGVATVGGKPGDWVQPVAKGKPPVRGALEEGGGGGGRRAAAAPA